jgi:hypothetical protein
VTSYRLRALSATFSAFVSYCMLLLIRTEGIDWNNATENLVNQLKLALTQWDRGVFLLFILASSFLASITLQRILTPKRTLLYRLLLVPMAFLYLGVLFGLREFTEKGDPLEIIKGLLIAPAGLLFFFIPILPGWILAALLDSLAIKASKH